MGFPGGGTTATSASRPTSARPQTRWPRCRWPSTTAAICSSPRRMPWRQRQRPASSSWPRRPALRVSLQVLDHVAAGRPYTVAGTGTWPGSQLTPAIAFTFQVYGFGMAVDSQGNIVDAGNGSSCSSTSDHVLSRYGKTLAAQRQPSSPAQQRTAKCGNGSVNVPGTGASSVNLQWPHPFVDPIGNVYFNDNNVVATQGCTWVLPASNGKPGRHDSQGWELYSLTGAATTTAIPPGRWPTRRRSPTRGRGHGRSRQRGRGHLRHDARGPGDRRVHRQLLRPVDDQGRRLHHLRRTCRHTDHHPG